MKKASILGIAAFLAAAQLFTGCSSQQAEEGQEASGQETRQEESPGTKSTDGEETGQQPVQSEDQVAEGQVASAEEMAEPLEVLEEGMTPIPGTQVKDGTYEIAVDSSSKMFRITHCSLTVESGKMTAVMTMGGTGYLKVFMGTGEEAVSSSESDYIPFVENEEGAHTYQVPVEALDAAIPCTAFSKNKEKWYDRTLVFRADSLPSDAFAEGTVTTPETLQLTDGQYTVEVTLGGGSGKAMVESPAPMRIENGQAYVTITFGSPNYDYMKVKEETYLPVNTSGNSAFEIPVEGFDRNLAVIADTIAMSEPHEISYTLNFNSASIKEEP